MSVDKAIESLKTVRLRGGIFGKTALLSMVLIIGVSAVAFKSEVWWLTLLLMFPLMGIVLYALKRSFDLAAANPYAAIMEGAELLQHEQIVHASKSQGPLPPSPPAPEGKFLPQEITDVIEHESPLPNDSSEVIENEPASSGNPKDATEIKTDPPTPPLGSTGGDK